MLSKAEIKIHLVLTPVNRRRGDYNLSDIVITTPNYTKEEKKVNLPKQPPTQTAIIPAQQLAIVPVEVTKAESAPELIKSPDLTEIPHLSRQQLAVLRLIHNNESTQTELIRKLHSGCDITPVFKSSMSRTIRQLTELGLVTEDTQRKISLSPKGKELVDK